MSKYALPDPDVIGMIAVCQYGQLGLITSVESDASGTSLYKGIHIEPKRAGKPWQSVDPLPTGHIKDLIPSTE